MLKEISSGFSKFFTRDKVIIFIALIILGYALLAYSGSKSLNLDGMGDGTTNMQNNANVSLDASKATVTTPVQNGYVSQAVVNPGDLLPKDQNSQWAALNPVGMKENVVMPDLLPAGYHIGLDTIGQTLRNANLQLRSDPIIQKQDVGPWNQSTIEADLGRVPLEIGYGYK